MPPTLTLGIVLSSEKPNPLSQGLHFSKCDWRVSGKRVMNELLFKTVGDPIENGWKESKRGSRGATNTSLPSSRWEVVATCASVVRDLPPRKGPQEPRAPTSHAPAALPSLVASLHLKGCRACLQGVYCMLGPFPQRSQNLPLNFPSTTLPLHFRILDHSTSSHPRAFAQALPPFLLCLIGIVTPARMNLCVFPRHLAHTRR